MVVACFILIAAAIRMLVILIILRTGVEFVRRCQQDSHNTVCETDDTCLDLAGEQAGDDLTFSCHGPLVLRLVCLASVAAGASQMNETWWT